MTDLAAWASGFFDGEGNVYIRHRRRGACTDHVLYVQVTQKDKLPLQILKSHWGGSITEVKNPSGCWRWRVVTAMAERFLWDILPHSVVKREQIEAALVIRSKVRKYKRRQVV